MRKLSFDLVIIGAGPAGLAAAVEATNLTGRAPLKVALLDDNPVAGGQVWRGGLEKSPDREARRWLEQATRPNLHHLFQTKVVAAPGDHRLLAESPTEGLEISYKKLILATGARERFLPFPGWTLPGVMGVGGLQALVKGGLPIAGKKVVVAGSGPLLLAVAAYLKQHQAQVRLIAEQTTAKNLAGFGLTLLGSASKLAQAVQLGRELITVPYRTASWVVEAHGQHHLESVTVCQAGRLHQYKCDYMAVGFGLVPNLELAGLLGCSLQNGRVTVDQWQTTNQPDILAAGEITGVGGVDLALLEGRIAGLTASDRPEQARVLFRARRRWQGFSQALESGFALQTALKTLSRPGTLVCRCEDVSYAEVQSHQSWRSAKLHTRCGMGPCQGRICGTATEFLWGWSVGAARPPVITARLGNLVLEQEQVPEV